MSLGSGSLTKNGLGTWTLDTSSSYTGGTVLNAGTLVLANTSGSALGSGNLTINGGLLTSPTGSKGYMTGSVNAGSGPYAIAPGGIGQIGQLTVGGLATSNLTTLDFDLGSPVSGGTYGGSLITVTPAGSLTIGSSTTINLATLPTATGDYRLLADSNTGTLSGVTTANFILPAAPALTTYTLSTTADSGYLDLVVAPSFTNPSFSLSASVAAHTIITGGTSQITTTLANNGGGVQPDTILYNGLSASTGAGGTITGISGTGSVAPANSGSYGQLYDHAELLERQRVERHHARFVRVDCGYGERPGPRQRGHQPAIQQQPDDHHRWHAGGDDPQPVQRRHRHLGLGREHPGQPQRQHGYGRGGQ
jgi:autotransporter-associated beta strand protein